METTSTNQLLIATWRASGAASARLAPTVPANTGAVLSGLMIGNSVTGTRTRPLRNAMMYGSMVAPKAGDRTCASVASLSRVAVRARRFAASRRSGVGLQCLMTAAADKR